MKSRCCYQAVAPIARHASAQSWHALAQALQCSIRCLAHSSPHDWQMLAHNLQMADACSLSRDIATTANAQMAAQSISSAMQRDAARHQLYIGLPQTRGGTVIAIRDASIARVDTGIEFVMGILKFPRVAEVVEHAKPMSRLLPSAVLCLCRIAPSKPCPATRRNVTLKPD